MKKTILYYGLSLALTLISLRILNNHFLIRELSVELYIGIIALAFTILGVWVGFQFFQKKNNTNKVDLNHPEKAGILQDLSQREKDVLLLINDGLSNQEIADKLFISIHTVKTHSSNLFSKLQVKRRTQAIQKAKKLGFID